IDVGARGGAHPMVEPLAALTKVLGFDPDADECRQIEERHRAAPVWASLELEPVALAETAGVREMTLTRAAVNHSLRRPAAGFRDRYRIPGLDAVGTAAVPIAALDDILFGPRARQPHWGEVLKVDAQGCDLDVLNGARRTLGERTCAVVVESLFLEAYEQQPRFSEIEIMLRGLGFAFYGFHSLNFRSARRLDKRQCRGRERLFYTDALFFRDPLPSGGVAGLGPRQAEVLPVCAALLGYYDFALEASDALWVDAQDKDAFRTVIHRLAACPPQQALTEVRDLLGAMEAHPDQALVLMGKFVDARRRFATYDDMPAPAG
ncbi:FkbM family methyltransferase, partial [Azospirillum melinis]